MDFDSIIMTPPPNLLDIPIRFRIVDKWVGNKFDFTWFAVIDNPVAFLYLFPGLVSECHLSPINVLRR
jgi:hypothetical protein